MSKTTKGKAPKQPTTDPQMPRNVTSAVPPGFALPDPKSLPRKPQAPKAKPANGKKPHVQYGDRSRSVLRHGLYAGSLPKDSKYIEHRVNALRRQLEDAVLAIRGEVSVTDAAAINSACKWEKHGQLCNRWLRKRGSELKPADLLKFSESTAKASDKRDAAIRLLKLDRDAEHDTLAALYAPGTIEQEPSE